MTPEEPPPPQAPPHPIGLVREFIDFLMLFFGISTESNLTRTQSHPVRARGLFLFRPKRPK